jgi:hypothetical protein
MRLSWCRATANNLLPPLSSEKFNNFTKYNYRKTSLSAYALGARFFYTLSFRADAATIGFPVRLLLHSLVSRSARHIRREGGGTIRALQAAAQVGVQTHGSLLSP